MLAGCAIGAASFLAGDGGERSQLKAALLDRAQNGLFALGFGIDQVSLTGHHFTPDQDVYAALDLDATRTFASFDATAALKRIEALPWVETAQITRDFPGALKVEINERRPTALWNRKGKSYLIDATGRVLGSVAEPHGWQLPRIAGEGAGAEAALLLTTLARHPAVASNVDVAERVGERRWSLRLKTGARIELGADREIEGLEQIARNSVLRNALSTAYVVDVRTPGRPAMRPLSSDVPTAALAPPAVASMTGGGR